MAEMNNVRAPGVQKGDVVTIGGVRCTVTTTEEWNERLWRLVFRDGSMLYIPHTRELDLERNDPDVGLIEAVAIRIAQSKGKPLSREHIDIARAAIAGYREYGDRDKEDPNA